MSDKKQVKLIMEVNKEDCDVVTTVTEKIVSTALGYTPMDAALKGANLGVSELDANGKVVASQLPSYVDDVIEGYLYNGSFYKESAHTTKITGESGKIYIDLSTGKTYRWSGSIYTVISETLALGETSSTAYRGDRGKIAYDHSQTAHAPSNAEKNQNAFANVKVGDTTIVADNTSDTLTLTAGDNITITPNVGSDTIAISATVATYGAAGSSLGLVKSGGDVTISSGVISVNDDSHNHVISNIDGLQNELNGKASTSAATTSANGLMTSAMVTKLNGITASADSVSFSRSLSSGTKVGTITINGTGTDLYAPSDTWRGIQNNLTSTSTTDSLSAAQGKALNDKIGGLQDELNGKASTSVATTSANGLMTSAMVTKLNGITDSADSVSFSRSLLSGTKVGTIIINGTGTDLYAPSNTWRGIQNNLTSTSTTDSLSAAQGKVLNEKFSNYLPLSGGTMNAGASIICHSTGDANETRYGVNSINIGGSSNSTFKGMRFLNGTLDDGDIIGNIGAYSENNDITQYIIGPTSEPWIKIDGTNGTTTLSGSTTYIGGGLKIGNADAGVNITQKTGGGFAMIAKYGDMDLNFGASEETGLTDLYAKKIYGSIWNEQDVLYSATGSKVSAATVTNLFVNNRLIIVYLETSTDEGDAFVVPLNHLKNISGTSGALLYHGNVSKVHFQYVNDNTIGWFEYQGSGSQAFTSVTIVRIY